MVRKYCGDPLLKHKKQITHQVLTVTASLAKKFALTEGTSICKNCINTLTLNQKRIKIDEDTISIASSATSDTGSIKTVDTQGSSDNYEDVVEAEKSLEPLLELFKESPIKKSGLKEISKQTKSTSKFHKLSSGIKRKLEVIYDTSIPESLSTTDLATLKDISRYKQLMANLKTAFLQSQDYKKKLQILTLSPLTTAETVEYFEAPLRMVKKSNQLRTLHGVLPDIPNMSKGKVISQNDMKKVRFFYESDNISRMCPGKKDSLRIRNKDGEKVTMQKRLLLGNLRELFLFYKEDPNNPHICFSSFANLRPKNCILAGQDGTHSVCVCTYHQNPKLQIAALGEQGLTYKDLMKKAVCDTQNYKCMMEQCHKCPREEGVKSFLKSLDCVEEGPDEVQYKKWTTVDRCTMEVIVESMDNYITSLSKSIVKLTRHHYVAQKQMEFFKDLKESLPINEGLLVGDFSENYSFIVQDAAQGFHWENSQCTLHPFVYYWRSPTEESTVHASYCFLSDCTKHSTSMVHSFLSRLLPELKNLHPSLTKIHYFSDGCAGQYKNRFNFVNLCFHKEDFGIICEWHFFATSHPGKNACDGIGGTVKRATTRASLQRCIDNQILTPIDMFNFCNEKLSEHIMYFFVTEEEVQISTKELSARFENTNTIQGTQKFHRFCPVSKDELHVYNISSDIIYQRKRITKIAATSTMVESLNKITAGTYIGCIYDNKLWFGIVEKYNEDYDDYIINFLIPASSRSIFAYKFPERKDSCPVASDQILSLMSSPTLKPGTTVSYLFQECEVNQCVKRMKERQKK